MKPRHTEEHAPEVILDLTAKLQKLCFGQPTTAEIEEALRLVRPIEVTLRAWMGSRRLNQSHAQRAAEFREKHPAVAEVVEGQTEAARVDHAHVHPVFAPLLAGLRIAQ